MRTKKPQLADQILDAAARLFARQRFHEVRMDVIACEAKVSKGTLYSHFKDKDALYMALLARGAKGLMVAIQSAASKRTSARAKLIAMVDSTLQFFEAEPHVFDLIQLEEAMSGAPAGFPWQEVRDGGLQILQEVFKQARQAEEFDIGDPELATWLLMGSVRAAIRFGKPPRPRRLAERVVDAFLFGTAPK